MLKVNTCLKILHLDNNSIGAEGAGYLAGALLQNKTVTYLEMSYNNIREAGIFSIATALHTNPYIEDLLGATLGPVANTILGLPEEYSKMNNPIILSELRKRQKDHLPDHGRTSTSPSTTSSSSSLARKSKRIENLILNTNTRRAALEAAYAKGKK